MTPSITPSIPIMNSFLKSSSSDALGGLSHYNAGINQLLGINFMYITSDTYPDTIKAWAGISPMSGRIEMIWLTFASCHMLFILTIITTQITMFAENTVLIELVIAAPTVFRNTTCDSCNYLGTGNKYCV